MRAAVAFAARAAMPASVVWRRLPQLPVAAPRRALSTLPSAAELPPGTPDLRAPHSWYPAARAMTRKVVCHLGPTNSGKTHHALARLKAAGSGVYCGPLRLLAWEVYERLGESAVACNLVTGQERELRKGARHVSCTVEMADVEASVDVAVLDEIQMIGDESRGWAWTRVLLGLPAAEIHCCGDPSALEAIQALCALTGDELEVRRYDRLSPLTVTPRPLRSLSDVQPGDCVIAFSRRELFAQKRQIEMRTGLRVGIIYGALPPGVRRAQARAFNRTAGLLQDSQKAAADAASAASSKAAASASATATGVGELLSTNVPDELSAERAAQAAEEAREEAAVMELLAAAGAVQRPAGGALASAAHPRGRNRLSMDGVGAAASSASGSLDDDDHDGADDAAVAGSSSSDTDASGSDSEDSDSDSETGTDVDEERTDVLVATDAIGMGLNLAIRRIVFSKLDKFDGEQRRPLSVSEMKQIGGRAGRFGSAFPEGLVTGMQHAHLPTLQKALATKTPKVRSAGIQPTLEHLEEFAAHVAGIDMRAASEYVRGLHLDCDDDDEDSDAVTSDDSGRSDASDSDTDERAVSRSAAVQRRIAAELPPIDVEAQLDRLMVGLRKDAALPVRQSASRVAATASTAARAASTADADSYGANGGLEGSAHGDSAHGDSAFSYLTTPQQHDDAALSSMLAASLMNDGGAPTAAVATQEEPDSAAMAAFAALPRVAASRADVQFAASCTEEDRLALGSDDDEDDMVRLSPPPPPPASTSSSTLSALDYAREVRRLARERQAAFTWAADQAQEMMPFSKILSLFVESAEVDGGRFFLCDNTDRVDIARKLDDIRMPFRHRYIFCLAPVDVEDELCIAALRKYAERFVRKGKVKVGLHPPTVPPSTPQELRELESAHAVFDLYLWLARRYPVEFVTIEQAIAGARQIQNLILEGLEKMGEAARSMAPPGASLASQRRAAAAEEETEEELGGPLGWKQLRSRKSKYWQSMADEDDEDDSHSRRERGRKRRFRDTGVYERDGDREDDDDDEYADGDDGSFVGGPYVSSSFQRSNPRARREAERRLQHAEREARKAELKIERDKLKAQRKLRRLKQQLAAAAGETTGVGDSRRGGDRRGGDAGGQRSRFVSSSDAADAEFSRLMSEPLAGDRPMKAKTLAKLQKLAAAAGLTPQSPLPSRVQGFGDSSRGARTVLESRIPGLPSTQFASDRAARGFGDPRRGMMAPGAGSAYSLLARDDSGHDDDGEEDAFEAATGMRAGGQKHRSRGSRMVARH